MFHARPEPMIRYLACSVLVCLAASCVPPKAILVEGPPLEKPKGNKQPGAGQEAVFVPQPEHRGGMRLPNPAQNLPDQREFTPTAQNSGGGSGLIVSPPGNRTSPPLPTENKPSE